MFTKMKKIRLTLAILLICLLIVAIYLVLNFGNESDTGMSTVKPEISDYSKSPTLTVDMSQRTGALKHGSAGFLYGLGEDGVPSAHIISPLNTEVIKLSAGKHRLEINYLSGSEGASVDCIYLSFAGTDLPSSKKIYQAELSDFNQFGSNKSSAVKTENTIKDYSGSGYVTGLNAVPVARGGGIRFNVMAESNGLYKLTLRYLSQLPGNVNLYLDNTAVTLNKLLKSIPVTASNNKWETMAQTVFLQKGINVIDIDADADTAVDYLEVGPAEKVSDKIVTVEAEECTLLGKCEILENPFSSGGKYVKGLLGDSDKENQLILNVSVPEAGHYKMVFYHSNSELFGGHAYNAQLVDRFAAIEVNGSSPVNVFFRNTYSDDCFRTRTVDVELKAGNNEIKIYNDASRKFRCGILNGDSIRYETLVNYTPNFDKFEFYPSVKQE